MLPSASISNPAGQPSIAGGDLITVLAEPGDVLDNQNFFLNPPDDPTGSGLGNITGFVFNDFDGDGIRDFGEDGLPASRSSSTPAAFNGILDAGEDRR